MFKRDPDNILLQFTRSLFLQSYKINEQIKGIIAMEKMRMAGMAYNVFKKTRTYNKKKTITIIKAIIEHKYNIIIKR